MAFEMSSACLPLACAVSDAASIFAISKGAEPPLLLARSRSATMEHGLSWHLLLSIFGLLVIVKNVNTVL